MPDDRPELRPALVALGVALGARRYVGQHSTSAAHEFADAALQVIAALSIPAAPGTCPDCACPDCAGRGWTTTAYDVLPGDRDKCSRCDGSGVAPAPSSREEAGTVERKCGFGFTPSTCPRPDCPCEPVAREEAVEVLHAALVRTRDALHRACLGLKSTEGFQGDFAAANAALADLAAALSPEARNER